MGNDHERGGEVATVEVPDKSGPTTSPGAGVHLLHGALRQGAPEPSAIADLIRAHPGDQNPMMQVLHQQVGNGFVHDVLAQMSVVNSADSPAPKTFKPGDPGASEDLATRAPGDQADTQSYKSDAKYAMLDGTAIASFKKTSQSEADVLNALRHNNKRFTPEFMLALQKRLAISNQSGAFNTETLRALRTPKHPHLSADDILANKDDVLQLQPGEQPFAEIVEGFGTQSHLEVKDIKDQVKASDGPLADQMAQALGYPSYVDYKSNFHKVTFLGKQLRGNGVMPHLQQRIDLADRWLRQRIKEKHQPEIDKAVAAGKDADKTIRQLAGWHTEDGNTAYGDTVGEIGGYERNGSYVIGAHPHSAGLAIDMEASNNPFVFDNADKSADEKWWTHSIHEPHLRRSAQLFGGEAITAHKMMSWSASMSTEELYAVVHKASDSFESYLQLAKKPDDVIQKAFTDKHFSTSDAEQATIDLKNYAQLGFRKNAKDPDKNASLWFNFSGHDNATKLTTHSLEMVVALRDVAGLAWGGTEMSETVNGDFMHFDCRQDGIGAIAQQFFLKNMNYTEKAPKKKPDEKAKP